MDDRQLFVIEMYSRNKKYKGLKDLSYVIVICFIIGVGQFFMILLLLY